MLYSDEFITQQHKENDPG